jgi:hypothetical protein
VSAVIIPLTVLTYYVWIAVTGESGRFYLKAWLEALGEDRARRLPTRSPTSADPSTRRSTTSSRVGGTCDKKAKLCSIPLEDKQAVLLPARVDAGQGAAPDARWCVPLPPREGHTRRST